jgi:hypothetical protein
LFPPSSFLPPPPAVVRGRLPQSTQLPYPVHLTNSSFASERLFAGDLPNFGDPPARTPRLTSVAIIVPRHRSPARTRLDPSLLTGSSGGAVRFYCATPSALFFSVAPQLHAPLSVLRCLSKRDLQVCFISKRAFIDCWKQVFAGGESFFVRQDHVNARLGIAPIQSFENLIHDQLVSRIFKSGYCSNNCISMGQMGGTTDMQLVWRT